MIYSSALLLKVTCLEKLNLLCYIKLQILQSIMIYFVPRRGMVYAQSSSIRQYPLPVSLTWFFVLPHFRASSTFASYQVVLIFPCFPFLPYYSKVHTEGIIIKILNNNLLYVDFNQLSEITRQKKCVTSPFAIQFLQRWSLVGCQRSREKKWRMRYGSTERSYEHRQKQHQTVPSSTRRHLLRPTNCSLTTMAGKPSLNVEHEL